MDMDVDDEGMSFLKRELVELLSISDLFVSESFDVESKLAQGTVAEDAVDKAFSCKGLVLGDVPKPERSDDI